MQVQPDREDACEDRNEYGEHKDAFGRGKGSGMSWVSLPGASSMLSPLLMATVSSMAWLTRAFVSASACRAASLVARMLPCLPGALITWRKGLGGAGTGVCRRHWVDLRGEPCMSVYAGI